MEKTVYFIKGRLTLIWSNLSILCIYFISFFNTPQNVTSRLEKIQRDFLWGCDALEKKLLLVKWLIIWKDKIKEGLGIRGWSSLNGALLGKWNWRCFLREKHSGNRSFRRSMKRENYQKWIRPFQKQSILEVGNDRRVKFWKDKWRVNKPLSVIPWSLGVLLFDVFNILILLT